MTLHITSLGRGFSLVFFHGFGFDTGVWDPLLPSLCAHYQLILVDLPGFGKTPVMDWEIFKSLLLEQLPERFALVGWSMGGLFATRLCHEAPNRVTHLFNVTSSPYFVKQTQWPGIEPVVLKTFSDQIKQDPILHLNQFIAAQLPSDKDSPAMTVCSVPTGLQAGLNTLLDWDLRDRLNAIEIPVCYLFGRLDAIVPYSLMLMMQQAFPQFSYTLLSRAAHAPFLSHPAEFKHALQDFLK